MQEITLCPICEGNKFSPFLTCVDYTVSRETFNIVQCQSCRFKFTNPIPDLDKLGDYYKSEEYISHSGSKKGIINKLYHYVRSYTLLKKLQLVERLYAKNENQESRAENQETSNQQPTISNTQPVTSNRQPKKTLLDIGCGTGEFLNTCKQAKWNVLGIEPGDDARKFASETYGLDVQPEDTLKTLNNSFYDIITMWHVLEHVPALNERISDLKRLIKPNGKIIIAVPNCSSADAETYKKFWAAYDVPRHLYHFTPQDIEKLIAKHGMRVEQILPMRFDSFYVSMLSDKYKYGKTNLMRSTWNGFISNIKAIKTGRKFSSQIYIISPN